MKPLTRTPKTTVYAVDIQRFADAAVKDVHRAEGGSDDDFSDTLPIANRDWLAQEASRDRYVGYFSEEHYTKRQAAARRRENWAKPGELPNAA